MSRAGVERSAFAQGNKALSESGGHPGGHFGEDSDSVASLRLRAILDLRKAFGSLKAWRWVCQDADGKPAVDSIIDDLRTIIERCEFLR